MNIIKINAYGLELKRNVGDSFFQIIGVYNDLDDIDEPKEWVNPTNSVNVVWAVKSENLPLNIEFDSDGMMTVLINYSNQSFCEPVDWEYNLDDGIIRI